MEITISYNDSCIYCDRSAIKVEDWENLKYPSGIEAVQYNTETNIGHIQYRNGVTMPIGAEQFKPVFGSAIQIYEQLKEKLEQERLEAVRKQAEIDAALAVEAQKQKEAELKEKVALNSRLQAVEEKLGIKVEREKLD